jgi:hypothetical protein
LLKAEMIALSGAASLQEEIIELKGLVLAAIALALLGATLAAEVGRLCGSFT